MDRISWHEYFMNFAELASKRSTCLSRSVGAVAIKDNRVIATGYNGAIAGSKHCDTCLRKGSVSGEKLDTCRGVHAEQNVIAQAAYHGVSVKDAFVYITVKPCNMCFKLLVNSGVKYIIFKQDYPDPVTDLLAEEAGFKKRTLYFNSKTWFFWDDENMKDESIIIREGFDSYYALIKI